MDKKLSGLLMLFVLVFGLFVGFVAFNKQISTFTRAKEELVPSSDTSLIFAWPLTAKADGNEKININVFVRNVNNLPLEGKVVSLKTNLGSLETVSATTDKSGKATFNLTSNSTGVADITAIVDNQTQLKQTVSIKFE
ncbi:Ig-like domain-containing protein [Patescibacteria group bacterium]|nr:Ig-like domain-containing protein [Patescibacteria group bacterium]